MATMKMFEDYTIETMEDLIAKHNLTLLSDRGAFTRAYVNPEKTEVYLMSLCPAKEIAALGWLSDSDLFPKIERLDNYIFKMEYFEPVKSLKNSLDPDQYAIYNELRRFSFINTQDGKNPHNNHSLLYKAFEDIKDPELREIMLDAVDNCANFGSDVCFEISPRNVAVKNGKLILLDVFFSFFKLKELYPKRFKY